ncbi:ABC transporter ATP-binding protein [Bacillus cereus]|uniref:ABC transporter domain-containing protein n=1 Tax=Bacillus cereus HuA3-9 TaxID=1053205 RepID=R8CAV9_BACCE|nr:ATP-binding cassette domain-containing protein [Bacillus cereus]EOO08757.1 hypothetical protein IGA_06331 [Bacillus cereus HuA3-9]
MIKVENLCKTYVVHQREPGIVNSFKSLFRRQYKNIKAVNNLSFEINSGEIVGFLGHNGAGKTTTLKMLTGLLHPTSGTLKVHGYEPQKRDKEFLKNITMVMGQKQQLSWDLTPVDSFLVNKDIYEISDKQFKQRLFDLSDLLQLEGILDKPVRKLSLGERMKCELVSSLLHQPTLLFLDEPTIGMDINMQVAIRNFIKEYNSFYKATIMLTSHYMGDVTSLAKRIIVINNGQLSYDGDIDNLTKKLSPDKILKLAFIDSVPDEIQLGELGVIRKLESLTAEILVKRHELKNVITKLMDKFDIADLSVEEIPIEESIGHMFSNKAQVKQRS